jgi:hypothetical protein
MQICTTQPRTTARIFASLVGCVAAGSLFVPGAQAATAATTAKKPTQTDTKTAAKPAAAKTGSAFCKQVTASQAVIGKAGGTPKSKLTAIGAEWTKIASSAPADIKADVLIVRTAYSAAAKAGVDTEAKAPAVATAGQKIGAYFAKNCGGGGIVASGEGPGGDGPGGPDNPERLAYRACLTKNGLTLPTPGQRNENEGGSAGGNSGAGANAAGGPRGGGFGLDPADPAVAKAMKACESLRPAGGFGGGGPGGRGGGLRTPEMQACLTKKGVKITLPTPGAAGGAGNRPAFDAKTQEAIEACRKELGNN